MVGALAALGGEHLFYYYDVAANGLDTLDLKAHGIDLVVATALLQLGDKNVPPTIYGDIVKRGVPVIMCWGESAPDVVAWADRYAPHVTANVFFDTAEHWRQFTKYPEKCRWLPEPKDSRVFNNQAVVNRDVPVSFVGSVLGRWDRAFNLAVCWANNIGVVGLGGLDCAVGSMEQYAAYLRQSQITLNFTSAITFQHINARTSEATLCGALLMESESKETERLLEPFVHYVPFKENFHIDEATGQLIMQQGDLVDKLRYYMGPGQAEARRIAEAGQKRAVELFDGRKFWGEMFRLAGIDFGKLGTV